MKTADAVLRELAEIGAIGGELPPRAAPVPALPPTGGDVSEETVERLHRYNEHVATLGPLLDSFQDSLAALNEWAEKTREFTAPLTTEREEGDG